MPNKNEMCEIKIIHDDIVNKVGTLMPKENDLYGVSEFFKMFADFTRTKILSALIFSEMCVCDISALLKMSHSSISHQLRLLKSARLVKNRKDGKIVYYSLDDTHISTIIEMALNHIGENHV